MLQLTSHLDEVFERRLVVGVNGHPFAPLRDRVDGVYADRDLPGQVPPYCSGGEFRWLSTILRFRPVVVVAAAIRVRPHGLNGIGPPVHEQLAELPGHFERCW